MSSSINPTFRTRVRTAQHQDTPQMAEFLYDGISLTKFFPVLYPATEKENWLDVQADYCAQHIGKPNSVAVVTQNEEGTVTGMAYGRFIPEAAVLTDKEIFGRDDNEIDKLENGTIQEMLTEKYGGVFCEFSFSLITLSVLCCLCIPIRGEE